LRFLPAGDLAVCVELGEEISVEVNTRVRALEFLIQQKGLTGVVETVPAYSSLLVYYDPRAVGYEPLCAAIAELVPQATTAVLPPARTVELPCCYEDPELGFDLTAAAKRLELSIDCSVEDSCDRLEHFSRIHPRPRAPGIFGHSARPLVLTAPRDRCANSFHHCCGNRRGNVARARRYGRVWIHRGDRHRRHRLSQTERPAQSVVEARPPADGGCDSPRALVRLA